MVDESNADQQIVVAFSLRFNLFINTDITWEVSEILTQTVPVSSLRSADRDYVDASRASLDLEITTGVDADVVKGGSGDDTINSGSGPDLIFGGPGDDEVNAFAPSEVEVADYTLHERHIIFAALDIQGSISWEMIITEFTEGDDGGESVTFSWSDPL